MKNVRTHFPVTRLFRALELTFLTVRLSVLWLVRQREAVLSLVNNCFLHDAVQSTLVKINFKDFREQDTLRETHCKSFAGLGWKSKQADLHKIWGTLKLSKTNSGLPQRSLNMYSFRGRGNITYINKLKQLLVKSYGICFQVRKSTELQLWLSMIPVLSKIKCYCCYLFRHAKS